MRNFTALGCYIFAGGFTLGVRKHFEVLAHFEEGPYGTATAAHNIPELRDRIFTDPATWPAADYAGRVDFVYGNPPCAPWSVCSAGRAVPWRLDPRVGCTQRLFGLLEAIQPKVWAFESVRPTFNKGRELIDEMVLKARDLGYDATALMVEGTRHGVPQKRPRFFLVLSRYALEWEPTRVKTVPTVGAAFAKPFKTFTHSNEGSKFFLDLVRKTQQGQRVAALFNELYPERVEEGRRTGEWVKGRPSFQNIRLDPTVPSCTLTGGAKQIHPTEHRLISVEESAALCGYPRGFKFLGSIGKQYQQVAQAVMPPVGEYLARTVRAGIEAKRRVRSPGFKRIEIFTDRIEVEPLEARDPAWWAANQAPLPTPRESTGAKATRAKNRTRAELGLPPLGSTATQLDLGLETPGRARSKRPAKDREEPLKAVSEPSPVRSDRGEPKRGLKAARAAAPGAAEPRRPGSGARIRELLQKGWDADRILETIHREFPQSRATRSDVNWNRRKLRTDSAAA